MRMQIRSPTPSALRSPDCANGSANRGSSPRCPAPDTASALDQMPRVREETVDRAPGLSVRLKLTLSYAGFLIVAGALMLAAAWLAGQPGQSFDFLLRYVPDGVISTIGDFVPGNQSFLLRCVPDGVISTIGDFVPGNQSFLLRAFAPAAAIALAFLLVFGLLGGWVLAGRMLAPLTRITDATRKA